MVDNIPTRPRPFRATLRALLGIAVVATMLLPVPYALADGGTGTAILEQI
ncbi:hypothetical protein [Nocardia lijiangensis]